jgi:hypothetical protein
MIVSLRARPAEASLHDFTVRIAPAQAFVCRACHHGAIIVSRPDHNHPIMAMRAAPDQSMIQPDHGPDHGWILRWTTSFSENRFPPIGSNPEGMLFGITALPAEGRKQMCKTSPRPGDECIAAAPDLWFEGLGFPHPVKAAKDPIRGANLIGSRVRQGCRGSARFGPGNGSRDQDQTSRMARKSGNRFSDRDMRKIRDV